jgi:2-oxoglutarate dehydrogenase E1 component
MSDSNALGPNEWLVDEMYEQYLADPKSVSASWQEFFEDYRRDQTEPVAAAPAPRAAQKSAAPAAEKAAAPDKDNDKDKAAAPKPAPATTGEPLRGAAARIVANMEESLHVPTATSFREVPARLLEVNRSVING